MSQIHGYSGAKDIPMDSAMAQRLRQKIVDIKKTIISYGVAPEAAEAIDIRITQHSLTITPEERSTGAWHRYADGQPFYAVQISAPGDMMAASADMQTPLPQMKPETQSLFIAFEMGMNLLPKGDQAVKFLFGVGDGESNGVTASIPIAEFQTYTRNDPAMFVSGLEELVKVRLNMLVPEESRQPKPAAQKRNAPKGPGGM